MAKNVLPKLLFAAVLGSAGVLASAAVTAHADDPQQPSLEETYDYPGADAILAGRGIRLIKGDGHITLATCASGTGQAEVWSRSKGQFCFRITGSSGWLTLPGHPRGGHAGTGRAAPHLVAERVPG